MMVLQTFLGVVFAKNRPSEVGTVRRENAEERRQTLLCMQSAKGGRAWQGVRFATGRRVHRSLWDPQKTRKDLNDKCGAAARFLSGKLGQDADLGEDA